MRAVVVYESLWGNTERIARAIAEGLNDADVEAQVVEAASAPRAWPEPVDLVIVGAPTHAFSLPSGTTRDSARQQGAPHIESTGVREWLASHGAPPRSMLVATFDTRTVNPRLPGSAAKKALKRLVTLGYQPITRAETFGVHGYSGPIADGEFDRARAWGVKLARLLVAR